ncbi:MAG: metalloregulator ArsR/SmtB family transcription factor [Patescibacteria group bacterium]
MKELEQVFKALANRRRLAIVKYLKKAHSASVGNIAEEIKLSFKATSKHLSILFNANILEKKQINLSVFYSITDIPSSIIKKLLEVL